MKENYDVITVGAGASGLSCGAWVTHSGLHVLVSEQTVQVEGCCSSYKRDGFKVWGSKKTWRCGEKGRDRM